MKGSFRKRGCKCPKDKKRCTCGATWSFRIDIGIDPVTGKRRQKEGYGYRTRAEAEDAAAKVYAQILEGSYVAEKNILFKDFAPIWLESYESSGRVKASTVEIRRKKLNVLLKCFANVQMKAITTMMYQSVLDDLAKKYARKTVASVHEVASLIFKKAVEMEIIAKDPTRKAQVPFIQKTLEEVEAEEEVPKYLEKDQLQIFLNAAKNNPQRYAVFLVLAYTGLRVGELIALKWKDIDFEEMTIKVTKTLFNKTGKNTDFTLTLPKTKKSKRTIDVDETVISELKKLKQWQKLIKMKYRSTYQDFDFVFVNDKVTYPGYPLQDQTVWAAMKRLLKRSNLPTNLSPHSLRHTHTSLLAEAGASLETIMERLGHESDVLTKRVYLHVTKALKKEASQKFSELMKSLSS
ncbi:Site-specific recombinase XerD [Paenibacillus sp. UNCCL117]|uniref:site-specific integrase n=1 Tax=unclassified Paenibacillus TaxID=185978 RepID=UPI0008884733|nr:MULTISPECIES: site-specific integrase [unclassified Paenibacillus]SDC68882.1 Site-specific recombinase XerD [Paenibacillus sp. cl123]SFW23747.1 Site-specific recombinase XerD [Paenibacillus sp. UNCCL117]